MDIELVAAILGVLISLALLGASLTATARVVSEVRATLRDVTAAEVQHRRAAEGNDTEIERLSTLEAQVDRELAKVRAEIAALARDLEPEAQSARPHYVIVSDRWMPGDTAWLVQVELPDASDRRWPAAAIMAWARPRLMLIWSSNPESAQRIVTQRHPPNLGFIVGEPTPCPERFARPAAEALTDNPAALDGVD